MQQRKADLRGKKVLFIAYFYPPVASTEIPGAMRTIKFIRNLYNGECHVLTVPPVVAERDSSLKHLKIPVNGESVYRVNTWDIFVLLLSLRAFVKKLLGKNAKSTEQSSSEKQQIFKSDSDDGNDVESWFQQFKKFVYNLCYFPDQGGPGILPAFLKGKKIVREQHLDLIFATGSPWSGLLVGYLISKATGKPLIADFRDPWTNNPFHQSKGKLLDSLSGKLERKVVEHAMAVSLNTEPLMDDFVERFPLLPASRFVVMPNGFDETDFASLQENQEESVAGVITLCHAGFLYGVRDPAVLLNAINKANIELAEKQRMIRFRQIGDVSLAYDLRERYAAMIEAGLLILDESRPYLECLGALRSADWVVNVQPATRSQVPSKLYDYLALNRPILNITPEDGALARLVKKHKLGELFGFGDEQALVEALVRIALSDDSRNFKGYPAREKFDCVVIAQTLADQVTLCTER